MDQQLRESEFRWGWVAKSGYCRQRLTPTAGKPVWVDEAFLVEPADAGHGVVDARVEIGTRDLLLASLSVEKPHVVLQTPVLLDDEFCFYVTLQQGGDSDLDADTDTDADTDDVVAVCFSILDPHGGKEEEEEEEEGEESLSSEDDDDDENHEEESEGTEDDDDDAMSFDYEDTTSSREEEESDGEVSVPAIKAAAVSGVIAFICAMTSIILAVYRLVYG